MVTYKQRAIVVETTFTVLACPSCGVQHGITTELEARRRKDGQAVYCPNGHRSGWWESEADKLRKELRTKEQQRDDAVTALQIERRRASRLENDLLDRVKTEKRLAKRIHAGVCPHCHRTFQQLARHMKSKHEAETASA